MIKKINHVGIVVDNIDGMLNMLSNMFGFKEIETFTDSEQTFKSSLIAINDVAFELIEPIGSQNTIAKFLRERGSGLHHLSIEVDDIDRELKLLQKMGTRLINMESQIVGNFKVAFIHPDSLKGVLIELVQRGC